MPSLAAQTLFPADCTPRTLKRVWSSEQYDLVNIKTHTLKNLDVRTASNQPKSTHLGSTKINTPFVRPTSQVTVVKSTSDGGLWRS